jgi:hypothetical protein
VEKQDRGSRYAQHQVGHLLNFVRLFAFLTLKVYIPLLYRSGLSPTLSTVSCAASSTMLTISLHEAASAYRDQSVKSRMADFGTCEGRRRSQRETIPEQPSIVRVDRWITSELMRV